MGQKAYVIVAGCYLQKVYKSRLIKTSTYQSFLKLILRLEMYQVFKSRMTVFIIFNSWNYTAHQIFK